MDNKQLWSSVLTEIELTVSKPNFNTWFKDTYIVKNEDGIVFLGVSNTFVKEWLLNKYHNTILKILRNLSETVRSLDYMIVSADKRLKETTNTEQKVHTTAPNELPLSDFYINKDDNLNPKYTLDSFIIGPFNELAHAAAQAVIKSPGRVYNPLFIYGNTGRGKTHLIQAIGNYIKTHHPEKKVYYITSEKFQVDFMNSVMQNKLTYFKEKYRKYDVFIMDDIQFLSNKEKSQEELFHLFNALYDANKQIVFSSDVHPNYIQNLEDRLKSRFSAGMIIDIPAPDHESRSAILKAKAKIMALNIASEAIEYISETIQGNIRDLEGVLNTISCHTQLKNKELSLSDIKNLIKNSSKPKKTISSKEVVKAVADFFNVEESVIYEKTRRKEIIKPRQIIMYILREDYNISFPSIGERIGGRDHTTVIHSCDKIKNDLKNDNMLNQEINQIRAMLA